MKLQAKASPMGSNRTSLIIWVAVAAIAIKALLLFAGVPAYQALFPGDYQADRFPDGYDLIAANLVEGHGYRFFPETAETTIRTPGFVLVLAGLFWAFGQSLAAVKAFHLVLSSVTAYLVYRLGLRITNNAPISAVASLLYFLFPGTIISDSRGGIETLLTFTIAIFMLLMYRALERKNIVDYAIAGTSFGAMMLVKSSPGLFPAFLFIYLLAIQPSLQTLKSEFTSFTVFALAAALVMSPWIIRNAALTGRFIPTMSVSGLAAFEGSYIAKHQGNGKEHFQLVWDAVDKQNEIARDMGLRFREKGTEVFPQFYSTEDELRYYDHLGEIVKQDFKQNPQSLLQVIKYNSVAFWFQGRTAKATLFNVILSAPFLALALAGLSLSVRRKYSIAPLALFVMAFYLAHLPVIAMARYYIPLVPLLSILGAIPIVWLGERVHQARSAAAAAAGRQRA
jgi:4-amino-4-deoxy-L-arabinose transferase-like glycosyltransferase